MKNESELNLLLQAIEQELIEIKDKNNILLEKYKKAIEFIKNLQPYEDYEYPFHAYEEKSGSDLWCPSELLRELGES